jgi:hypothetical protein
MVFFPSKKNQCFSFGFAIKYFLGTWRKATKKDRKKKLGYNLKNYTLEASSRRTSSKFRREFSKLHQEKS